MSTNQAPQNDESQNVARTEWDGEGLPPVGTSCEGYIYADTAKQGAPMNRWAKGEFVGEAWADNGGCMGLLKTDDGRIHAIGAFSYFRPVRTPEQIAAEERAQARTEVLNAMTADGRTKGENEENWQFRMQIVGEMLDMGFRKP